MQRWLFKAFPDTASQYLFPEPGKLLEPIGEALLLHACKPVHKYVIFWNQTYNGSCYPNFPVTSPDLTKVYFLELNQRRLVSQGHKLKCTRTKKLWYISDIKGTLWRLTDGKFHKVAQYLLNMPDASYPMRKIAHFDLRLLHYDNKNPTRLSLLALLARNKDNLEDLTNYRTEGKGDIISGIGKFLGTTISALAKGGSLIIRSLGQGIHDTLDGVGDLDKAVVGSIGNATTNVI